MRSCAVVFCILLTLPAATASGQVKQVQDGIGIYADLEGTSREIFANSGIVEIYVLATNLQAEEGIAVWEMGLSHNGPLTFVGYEIPYTGVDISRFPNMVVAPFEPLPQAPIIHLMTLRYRVADSTPAEVFIKEFTGGFPAEGGSLNNYLPVYGSGPVGPGNLRNLYPTSGSISLPVFRVNGAFPAVPAATESETWGDIKAAYR